MSIASSEFVGWIVGRCAASSVAPSDDDKGVDTASKGTQSGGIVIEPVKSSWIIAWSSCPWESRLVQIDGSN